MSIGNKEATNQMKSAYQKFLVDNDKVDIYSTRKYFYEGYNYAQRELSQKLAEREAELREALEVIKFYADSENYELCDRKTKEVNEHSTNSTIGVYTSITDDNDSSGISLGGLVNLIGGKRARTFLEKMEGKK